MVLDGDGDIYYCILKLYKYKYLGEGVGKLRMREVYWTLGWEINVRKE